MTVDERITTLQKKHEDELQEKRLQIMELEGQVAQLREDLETQTMLTQRFQDELSRTRSSLNAQIDKLVNAKTTEIAQQVKQMLGVKR